MAKLINVERQKGKTTAILNQMKKEIFSVMIVTVQILKNHLIKQNPEFKKRIMTLPEYHALSKKQKAKIKKVHIDELNYVLGIENRLGILTMTNYPGQD